jgi:hypothetical protein
MQKNVVIQSTVNVVNYLEIPLELGFYLNQNENNIENTLTIKPGKKKYIQLKYIYNSTWVRFKPLSEYQ